MLVDESVDQTQQDSIQQTVTNAAGINTDRGDTVSVEPLPFSSEMLDREAAMTAAEKEAKDRIFYLQLAAILVILAMIGGAIYIYRRKKLQEEAAAAEAARKKKEEEERLAEIRAAAVANGDVEEGELTEEEQRHLDEKQTLMKLIDDKPAEVAMLIKTWLQGDE